jgi:hypothetical protein
MGSPWERMPAYMAEEVMEQLKWDSGASKVFRQICKGWRDTLDQSVTRSSVTGDSLPSSFVLTTRFQRLKEIVVRFESNPRFANIFYNDDWLRTFASLTTLTSLDLTGCGQVSDDGLHALSGLTALTSLNLEDCGQVSDAGLRALAGLTALIRIN